MKTQSLIATFLIAFIFSITINSNTFSSDKSQHEKCCIAECKNDCCGKSDGEVNMSSNCTKEQCAGNICVNNCNIHDLKSSSHIETFDSPNEQNVSAGNVSSCCVVNKTKEAKDLTK